MSLAHPILFHVGSHPVPAFAVLAVAGLLGALALGARTARLAGIDPERSLDGAQFALTAEFVVSRALLVAANWRAFVAMPLFVLLFPSLTPLGVFLSGLATLLWLRRRGVPVLPFLDAWAPGATLLWCFLALGHLAEGSDPGLPARLPFGIGSAGEGLPAQPVALYVALCAGILTLVLWSRLRRPHARGGVAGLALAAAGVIQFLLSFLREPGLPLLGLDALQVTALVLLGAGGLLTGFAVRQGNEAGGGAGAHDE